MKPLTLAQLNAVQDAVLQNARDLVADAELLESNARLARAFSVAILASEELAKSMFIGQACEAVALGQQFDWATLERWVRQHDKKLAVMRLLDVLSSSAEVENSLFLQKAELETQIIHQSEINAAKQDGFYVDIADDGTPISPAEAIDADDVRAAIGLAKRGSRFSKKQQLKREMGSEIPKSTRNC